MARPSHTTGWILAGGSGNSRSSATANKRTKGIEREISHHEVNIIREMFVRSECSLRPQVFYYGSKLPDNQLYPRMVVGIATERPRASRLRGSRVASCNLPLVICLNCQWSEIAPKMSFSLLSWRQ